MQGHVKRPAAYASRILRGAEIAYSVYEKEHLVVYMHMNTFIIFFMAENLKLELKIKHLQRC